jgi:hypothetical protein
LSLARRDQWEAKTPCLDKGQGGGKSLASEANRPCPSFFGVIMMLRAVAIRLVIAGGHHGRMDGEVNRTYIRDA